MTHYIPPFMRNGPGGQQAICGVYTMRHSAEPECTNCKHLLEASDEPKRMPSSSGIGHRELQAWQLDHAWMGRK